MSLVTNLFYETGDNEWGHAWAEVDELNEFTPNNGYILLLMKADGIYPTEVKDCCEVWELGGALGEATQYSSA